MIYEFLYKDKPLTALLPIILFIFTAILLATTLYGLYSKHSTIKDKVDSAVLGVFLTTLVGISFLVSSAIYIYDHVTTPSENTKTTDLYRITKEKDYLTFTSKKPYNHLYRTKTMEITYTSNGDYVIVTDNQAYRIPKESVSE